MAGVIWERPCLPPLDFFTWLQDCRLVKARLSAEKCLEIKPTERFLELLAEGMWMPPFLV